MREFSLYIVIYCLTQKERARDIMPYSLHSEVQKFSYWHESLLDLEVPLETVKSPEICTYTVFQLFRYEYISTGFLDHGSRTF